MYDIQNVPHDEKIPNFSQDISAASHRSLLTAEFDPVIERELFGFDLAEDLYHDRDFVNACHREGLSPLIIYPYQPPRRSLIRMDSSSRRPSLTGPK